MSYHYVICIHGLQGKKSDRTDCEVQSARITLTSVDICSQLQHLEVTVCSKGQKTGRPYDT